MGLLCRRVAQTLLEADAVVGWGVQPHSQILSRRVTFVAGTPALLGTDAREVVSVSALVTVSR